MFRASRWHHGNLGIVAIDVVERSPSPRDTAVVLSTMASLSRIMRRNFGVTFTRLIRWALPVAALLLLLSRWDSASWDTGGVVSPTARPQKAAQESHSGSVEAEDNEGLNMDEELELAPAREAQPHVDPEDATTSDVELAPAADIAETSAEDEETPVEKPVEPKKLTGSRRKPKPIAEDPVPPPAPLATPEDEHEADSDAHVFTSVTDEATMGPVPSLAPSQPDKAAPETRKKESSAQGAKDSPSSRNGRHKLVPGGWKDVSPMIGTGAHGNVWVGAGSPHGLAKLAVDSRQSRPGYSAWKPITGTSFVHVSGTGGPESYQVPTAFPLVTFGAKAGQEDSAQEAQIPPWFKEVKERHAGTFKSGYHPPDPPPGYAMPDAPPESANKMPPDEGRACCTKMALWSGRKNETVSVGYYGVTLDENDVHVEMAANGKVGIQRWTVLGKAATAEDAWLTAVIDISKHATEFRHWKNGTAKLTVVADPNPNAPSGSKKLRIQGGGTYTDGWSEGLGTAPHPHGQYSIFFCGETDTFPSSVGFWDGSSAGTDSSKVTAAVPSDTEPEVVVLEVERQNQHLGLFLSFPVSSLKKRAPLDLNIDPAPQLEFRLGLSGKNQAAACRNYEASVFGHPEKESGSFEAAVDETRKEWDEVLSSVELDDTASPNLRTQFFSALYRSFLMPTNYTGDEPARWGLNASNVVDYYTDYYTLWDIFRTQLPLVSLLRPDTGAALVRSLIAIWKAEGWMPDSRVGAWNGITQLGSNGDCVLADAIVKGLPLSDADKKDALAAAKKDAEVEPPNWFLMGRGGVGHWKALGYIPVEPTSAHLARSAGRTLEYSYNDYCIYEIAEHLGIKEDAETYLKQSANWRNLWNPNISSMNATGFIMGKNPDGTWAAGQWTDPTYCAPGSKEYDTCYLWRSWFYESSSWTYSFYAPHDMAALVRLSGGKEAFVQRLDAFFYESKLYDPSNEPSFMIPFGYIYAGRCVIVETACQVSQVFD